MMAEGRGAAKGAIRKRRHIATMLATLGMLLYAALVPGHVVSSSGMAHAVDGAEASPDCHIALNRTGQTNPASPTNPAAPKKHCPFCSGYAAFQAAMAGETAAVVLDRDPASPDPVVLDDGFVEVEARRPQNRGPPIEL
jgi:hypothetical protein